MQPLCFRTSRGLVVWLLLLALSACGGGGSGNTPAPSALSYPNPQAWTVGTPIMPVSPTVSGSVASFSVSPTLPAGVALNPGTGQISGTPAAASAVTTYTITARNESGSTSFGLSITVNRATVARLEPTTGTTIGVGQSINVFQVLDEDGAPYPRYVEATLITWSSSNPARASISANGVVTGLAEGTTTITALYQSFRTELNVTVSGAFLPRTLSVAGQGARRYSIYVPPSAGNTAPRPLLLALHGGGGTALSQAAMSQLVRFAHEQQIVVAFLEGTGAFQTFNGGACCGTAQSQNIDDVLYVRTAIDDIQQSFSVDAARVFATGFSNGAIMSHRLACALADRIAGIAPIGGGSGEFDRALTQYYSCAPARPIPILHIHATNDRNYPFNGGVGQGFAAGSASNDFYPIDATIADWIERNNVTSQAVIEQVTATTACTRYAIPADTARPSAPVTLCKLDPPDVYDAATMIVFGGGHSWPGGVRSAAANSDVPVTDFNANAYMWAFLNP